MRCSSKTPLADVGDCDRGCAVCERLCRNPADAQLFNSCARTNHQNFGSVHTNEAGVDFVDDGWREQMCIAESELDVALRLDRIILERLRECLSGSDIVRLIDCCPPEQRVLCRDRVIHGTPAPCNRTCAAER